MNNSSYTGNKKLTYEENEGLLKRARDGDKEALDQVVELNLPLVTSICKKFMNRGYDYEDLFQIGCIGLVKAINNFDHQFNVKFSTYAVPMIMGEIKRFFRDDGIIKVSRSIKNNARTIHFCRERLLAELGREPTVEELAKAAELTKEEVLAAIECSGDPQYLYDTIHQDDGAPVLLIDKISNDRVEDRNLVERLDLKEAIRDLDSRARQVIVLRYFKDKTQVQVAELLGISQVQVSRIEKKVLKQMKSRLAE